MSTTGIRIEIERRWDGMYDVIERGPDAFLVLGSYADLAVARKNAARWQAESDAHEAHCGGK